VIGSLTAIGNIVYAAEFNGTSTTGFAMKTGRPVFHYPRGTYTPAISDGHLLYLIGYSSISALEPFKYTGRVSNAVKAPKAKPRPAGGAGASGGPERRRGRASSGSSGRGR
jgi:hypothetical protein